mmetsp:Transcript_47719/g.119362  ORF Transcript_47719/g.119362 Transcript_47719/m.119362 type:complete len:232 (+) Transcript_47719:74-769(+)
MPCTHHHSLLPLLCLDGVVPRVQAVHGLLQVTQRTAKGKPEVLILCPSLHRDAIEVVTWDTCDPHLFREVNGGLGRAHRAYHRHASIPCEQVVGSLRLTGAETHRQETLEQHVTLHLVGVFDPRKGGLVSMEQRLDGPLQRGGRLHRYRVVNRPDFGCDIPAGDDPAHPPPRCRARLGHAVHDDGVVFHVWPSGDAVVGRRRVDDVLIYFVSDEIDVVLHTQVADGLQLPL